MKKSIPMPRMKSIPMPRMKPITITLGTLLALSLGSAAIAGCGRTILHESTPSTLPEGGANPLDAEYATRAPLEVLEGRASYYADSLAGNHTANGEIYDIHAFTAASRELPFGTIVRVVRIVEGEASGPSVTVRVNDRGPFGDSRRILDLSRAAAEQLEMIRAGVITIRAEILERPEPRRRRR